jgi:lipopolysaccharide/colanic/teichoic acid biosynthesis glycosyltransferase
VFGLLIWSFAVVAVRIILSKRSAAKKKLRKLQASEQLLSTSKHSMGQHKPDFEEREIEGLDETGRRFWGIGPDDVFALSGLSIIIVIFFVTGVLIYRTSKGDILMTIGRLRINGVEVAFEMQFDWGVGLANFF